MPIRGPGTCASSPSVGPLIRSRTAPKRPSDHLPAPPPFLSAMWDLAPANLVVTTSPNASPIHPPAATTHTPFPLPSVPRRAAAPSPTPPSFRSFRTYYPLPLSTPPILSRHRPHLLFRRRRRSLALGTTLILRRTITHVTGQKNFLLKTPQGGQKFFLLKTGDMGACPTSF